MKKTFLLLLLLVSIVNYSQTASAAIKIGENDKIIYLDSTRFEIPEKEHQFYRIVKDYKLEKSSYTVYEFNKLGVLQKEGETLDKEGFREQGVVTYYYENGVKKSLTSYVKGNLNGTDTQWYDNGKMKLEGVYIADEKKGTSQFKINNFWDVNGVQKVTNGNGFFEDQDEDGFSKGEIKNGEKEGSWEGLLKKFELSYKELYKNGKLLSGVSTEKNGDTYTYKEVEIAPEPKKGVEDFYKFIGKNFIVPDVSGLNGKIYVSFVIDKTGKIVETKALRDIGYGTAEEAVRVVTEYNGFIPGEQRGKKVSCSYRLPITIHTPN